jgi:hypothetical protein
VDREAASLVAADWALAHLAVPIVKAGRTLTVVVANPLDSNTLDDLAARTGMTPDDGALPQLRAATDPSAKGGEFYGPLFVNNGPPIRKPIFRRLGMDKAIATLWDVSERETGVALPL